RKRGPSVWVLRYRKAWPDGSTKLASKMIGTKLQYPTKSQARKAAEAFLLSVNSDNPARHGVSWGALIERYVADAMPKRNSSRRGYNTFLNNFIRPKWAEYAVADVTSFAVQEWLKNLKRSNDSSRSLAPK